ncbi:TetR/AcrR family transcriptional regulator [Aminobacter ciceronei]|uniref:AcrR family transcriptional regulator n=1 Tax=Aminobacter ciceronei TaxID=150723 RepID=A0ABR6C8H8_9HYPH|nr:TetR/AcrR family transcriptional regulator C-terminal domain-containing protein [Aminobacter ciceronei]MBA8907185.1 AcrR family transcriptional regulator [Aminobacter ciceronei]MBA9021036.1 AcrR family transcriptional regulator [Aminobacter ciceronei]
MDRAINKKRAKLSRDMIERAAFEVIEREGMGGFSMRKLAQALGCEAMSIYHHYASQAHLFEALVERLVGELQIPPRELPWRQRARAVMGDFRAIGRAHPAFAPFLVTYRMNSPKCLAWLDGVLGVFEDGGFGKERAARLFRAVGYYLMGAILDETAGYARGASAVTTVDDEQLRRDYPNVAAAGPFFSVVAFDKTFDLGLDMLLDEMEREVASNGRATLSATPQKP